MHTFRTAADQEALDKVEVFKHDNMFNNWIDPKVLSKYTEDPLRAWKNSYGFSLIKTRHQNISAQESCHMKFLLLVSPRPPAPPPPSRACIITKTIN